MGPLEAIKAGFAKIFQFSGRASRSEFWWYFAFLSAFAAALLLPWLTFFQISQTVSQQINYDLISGETTERIVEQRRWNIVSLKLNWISILLVLAFATLTSAALARRCHDVGTTGWLPFVVFAGPTILAIVLAVLTAGLATVSPSLAAVFLFLAGLPLIILKFVLPIVGLIRLLQPSEEGVNEYDPTPNEVPS